MKRLGALGLLLSGAAFANYCDLNGTRIHADRLSQAALGYSQAVMTIHGHQQLSTDAQQLHVAANAVVGGVTVGGTCVALEEQYRTRVAYLFNTLETAHRAAQAKYPDNYLVGRFDDIRFSFIELGRAVTSSVLPPPPPPPHDPCVGYGGYYQGVCRVQGSPSTSYVSFSVGPQGNRCVAYQSSYFQTTRLRVGAGYATASVAGVPGGVAISNTTLTVYGGGRFNLTGYNYAGNFYFTCQ